MPVTPSQIDPARLAAYQDVIREVKYIVARPKAYTWESFVPYFRIANQLLFSYEADQKPLDETSDALIAQLPAARARLVQVADPEDTVWYIWGERMAQAPDADQYDYFYRFDYPGFRPFLVPYLLPDQAHVKGNLIVIAGGGYSQRWNQTEGYHIAEGFNALGYNAYVLQRRVTPSPREDSFLDLQRSIRYLKYHADALGIGAIDHLATVGFSGGGMTIIGALERCYGDRSPCEIYPDYIPDEIDAVNADYPVAMPIYGGFAPKNTENTNLPSLFVAVGARDQLILRRRSETDFFDLLHQNPDIDLELHVFAGAGHGFGTAQGCGPEHHLPGPGFVGADNWMRLADDFMMVRFGLLPQTYARGER